MRQILLTFEIRGAHGASYGFHSLKAAVDYFERLDVGQLDMVTWRCPHRADGLYRPCAELLAVKRAGR